MNDMQVQEVAAPAATVPDAAAPANPVPEATAAPEEGTADGGDSKPKAPEKTYSREDIKRMLAREVGKEKRRLEREITERVRSEVSRPTPDARQAVPQSDSSDAPKLPDFPDYESWVRATSRWEAKQELKAEFEKAEKARESARAAERAEHLHERVVVKGSKLYEDFEDVALDPDLPVTDPMLATIAESDHGPTALYYLGQHPEEAARIAGLSPANQVRAIDKIIATLTKPAEPTKAPEPIKPNAGAGGSSYTVENAPDYATWVKARNRQLGRT